MAMECTNGLTETVTRESGSTVFVMGKDQTLSIMEMSTSENTLMEKQKE